MHLVKKDIYAEYQRTGSVITKYCSLWEKIIQQSTSPHHESTVNFETT